MQQFINKRRLVCGQLDILEMCMEIVDLSPTGYIIPLHNMVYCYHNFI